MSKLKQIDFSDGIYPDEINDNFDKIINEVERERKNIGGSGIASGLELEVINDEYNFGVKLSEASIIANDGSEIYLPEKFIEIDRPKLSKEIEYLTVNSSNQIVLKHIPYSLNRRFPVQYTNNYSPEASGIDIKYRNSQNEDDYIRVKSIDGKTLTLSGITRNDVTIIYHYTDKRIDTLYLDDNYEVKVMSGITSPTPSAVLPPRYKYLIASVEVHPHYMRPKDKVVYAEIIMKKDLRKTRNIYTGTDGKLYICGVPFEDLQVINIIEPDNPKENDLWLNTFNNTLNVWKSCDEFTYRGQIICETNFSTDPLFKQDYQTDIDYYVGEHQLKVYVNDIELSTYEFAEIKNGTICNKLDKQKKVKTKEFRIYKELSIGDKINYRIRFTDSQYMWVPINKTTFNNAKEVKLFGPTKEYEFDNYFSTDGALAMGKDEKNYPRKYQYFIFHYDKDRNMLYTPGRNELSIMINQSEIHKDQFEEITFIDLIEDNIPASVRAAAEQHFGWDIGIQSRYNNEFDNLGIGFKMVEPLDVSIPEEVNGATDLYVEASVERRISDAPFKRKLQRSSTFVYEKNIKIPDSDKKIVDIEDGMFYRFKEKQLEIYINGIRQVNGIDYHEGPDIPGQGVGPNGEVVEFDRYAILDSNFPERARGSVSKQFEIDKNNQMYVTGAMLTYRITTNIYSYDHINTLLDDIEFRLNASVEKVDASYERTVELQENMNESINYVLDELSSLKGEAGSMEGKYLTTNSMIKEEQLPASIVANKVQSLDHINFAIEFQSGKLNYDVTDNVREADFIVVIKRDRINQNDRMLIRNVDYRIVDLMDSSGYAGTTLNILTSVGSIMNDRDTLIITGVKFGKAGRK